MIGGEDRMPPTSAENRRCEPRLQAPGLQISLRRAGLFGGVYRAASLLNIDRGGLGLIVKGMRLRVGDKVSLRLRDGSGDYSASGVVSHRQAREEGNHCGIIFIHVPHELDCLIEALLAAGREGRKAPAGTGGSPPVPVVPGTHRRADPRHPGTGFDLRVRRPLPGSAFVPARLHNIGRGGAAFTTDMPPLGLGSRIELRLAHDSIHYLVPALVSHVRPLPRGTRFGVEFISVPPRLSRVIDALAASQS